LLTQAFILKNYHYYNIDYNITNCINAVGEKKTHSLSRFIVVRSLKYSQSSECRIMEQHTIAVSMDLLYLQGSMAICVSVSEYLHNVARKEYTLNFSRSFETLTNGISIVIYNTSFLSCHKQNILRHSGSLRRYAEPRRIMHARCISFSTCKRDRSSMEIDFTKYATLFHNDRENRSDNIGLIIVQLALIKLGILTRNKANCEL